jgi:hypothetical protein
MPLRPLFFLFNFFSVHVTFHGDVFVTPPRRDKSPQHYLNTKHNNTILSKVFTATTHSRPVHRCFR